MTYLFFIDILPIYLGYLLIAATGDEVLDWREMVAFMPDAHHIIVPGSDHGLSNFETYMPRVLAFAGVPTP
jgi:predicted esterase YcpF (UPF0227 family)